MFLEIVDYTSKVVYTGEHGMCILLPNGMIVETLMTDEEEYVFEVRLFNEQLKVTAGLKTLEEAKSYFQGVLEEFAPAHLNEVEKLSYRGFARYPIPVEFSDVINTLKDIAKLSYSEDSVATELPDSDYTLKDALAYAEADSLLTLDYYKRLNTDPTLATTRRFSSATSKTSKGLDVFNSSAKQALEQDLIIMELENSTKDKVIPPKEEKTDKEIK